MERKHWIEKSLVLGWAVIRSKDHGMSRGGPTDEIRTEPIVIRLNHEDSMVFDPHVRLQPFMDELVQVLPAKHGTLLVEIVRDGFEIEDDCRHFIGFEHPIKNANYDEKWAKQLSEYRFSDERCSRCFKECESEELYLGNCKPCAMEAWGHWGDCD